MNNGFFQLREREQTLRMSSAILALAGFLV